MKYAAIVVYIILVLALSLLVFTSGCISKIESIRKDVKINVSHRVKPHMPSVLMEKNGVQKWASWKQMKRLCIKDWKIVNAMGMTREETLEMIPGFYRC